MPLIESVPNVSEGRRREVVEALAEAIRSTPGVQLLDYSCDRSHNRSVFTVVGAAAPLKDAIVALYTHAVELIDLRQHSGQHPRVGAVDVVPFVPLEGATTEECVALARDLAATVVDRFGIPVYLYEDAATRPSRRNLEEIRRGEFEGLAQKMRHADWHPDFGPAMPHPSAGVSVIGARRLLIAYNINLETDDLEVAQQIAAVVRASSGGLPFVKALGIRLDDPGRVQVSMNLTNYHATPIFRLFDTVAREAARLGIAIHDSEIVGLVPAAALIAAAAHYLRLERFTDDQVLEAKLRLMPSGPPPPSS